MYQTKMAKSMTMDRQGKVAVPTSAELFVLGRSLEFEIDGRNLLIITDPGADIDDEVALGTLLTKYSKIFNSIHICIVDGVEAKPGTPSEADMRWENFKEIFTNVFTEHNLPHNVVFHTSKKLSIFPSFFIF